MMAKRAQRRINHRRQREVQLEPTESLYVHDKITCECRVEIFQIPLDDQHEITAVHHYNDRAKIVWFSFLLYQDDGNRRIEIYSVDTDHGYYHEHKTGHQLSGDRKDLRPLFNQENVQESVDDAYERVMSTSHRNSRR